MTKELVEEVARVLTPCFLELTGDYTDVPPDAVWTRPRYEHLKMWFCRLTEAHLLPILARQRNEGIEAAARVAERMARRRFTADMRRMLILCAEQIANLKEPE